MCSPKGALLTQRYVCSGVRAGLPASSRGDLGWRVGAPLGLWVCFLLHTEVKEGVRNYDCRLIS